MQKLYASLITASMALAPICEVEAQSKTEHLQTAIRATASVMSAEGRQGEKRSTPVVNEARGGGVANDEPTGAIAATLVPLADCGTGSISGDNTGATQTGAAPDCDDPTDEYPDVWYSFNSGDNAQVRILFTAGTITDYLMEVQTTDGTVVDCVVGTTPFVVNTTANTDYLLRVATNLYWGDPGTFELCFAYIPASAAPVNDNCGDVADNALALGGTLNFTGTTVGATNTGDFEAGSELEGEDPTVWHKFTTTECANVTISYCGTAPAFGNVWIFLSPSCPAGDNYLLASSYNFTTCSDGNAVLDYTELPAGTYYIPVMQDLAAAFGPYSLEVTAVACPLYCSAGATSTSFEKIGNVEIGSFANASTSTAGYEDFSGLTVNLEQGANVSVTVTITTPYDDDQVLLWIDLDQSDSFEANELLWTSATGQGPHTGTIAIPAGATLGETRLRIRMHDSVLGGNAEPCGNSSYGQVEDYTANITPFTSIGDVNGASFSLFPNPTNGDITLAGVQADGRVVVEIMDMTGRVVFREGHAATRGANITLPLAGKVAAGTYGVHLVTNAGRSVRTVIVH